MTDLPYTMMKTVDVEELHARIAELEAEALQDERDCQRLLAEMQARYEAELATVPKWTLITDDPETWPEDDWTLDVLLYHPKHPSNGVSMRTGDEVAHLHRSYLGHYWFPIIPPQAEP